jgi:hypothetical protein
MAKFWPVYEGKEPTSGGPWAELPVSEAVTLFELRPSDFVSDLTTTPRFGDVHRDRRYARYKRIIVEVDSNEKGPTNWKPGFHKSRITPKEAFGKLIQRALASELGDKNLVRVEWEPTTDSQGRDALKTTAVLAPGANQRLDGRAVLDALVKEHEQLSEMRDERIPIVENATEEELAQDAAPQS